MLQFAVDEYNVSTFFLHGYFALDASDAYTFIVAASLVAQVPDVALRMIMADNRVGITAPEIDRAMISKMQEIRELPCVVWSTLAAIAHIETAELLDKVVHACHRSYAFFHWRVLSVAYQLPWTLVRGNIHQNLVNLAEGDCPSEPIAKKLWELLALGVCMASIMRMIRLLADSPWSSMVV